MKQVRLEENAILSYTRNLSVLLHYSCVNITIRDRWSINGKMRFCTSLTVKGWSSTLPTATAALSSNVFVAPVSTWWSFILFSLHSSFILQLTTINSEVLHPVGRHICLDLLRKHMAVYGSYMTYLSKMSTSTEVVFVVAVADSHIFSQRFILSLWRTRRMANFFGFSQMSP